MRAALKGRLVLSKVHTNAPAAIDRLRDLGVPPYLLAETLRGVLSQRLMRRTCVACEGAGCAECGDSGSKGRRVASDLLEVTRDIATGIAAGQSAKGLMG